MVTRVETFTRRKLLGVLTSLTGILLISRVDLSSSDSPDNGSFPFKGPGEMALGDAMAGISAVLYGVYTVVMKKKVGDEGRVDMPLFFGLVGLINTFLLWPGFFVLHLLGIETLGLPETGRVWMIITVWKDPEQRSYSWQSANKSRSTRACRWCPMSRGRMRCS